MKPRKEATGLRSRPSQAVPLRARPSRSCSTTSTRRWKRALSTCSSKWEFSERVSGKGVPNVETPRGEPRGASLGRRLRSRRLSHPAGAPGQADLPLRLGDAPRGSPWGVSTLGSGGSATFQTSSETRYPAPRAGSPASFSARSRLSSGGSGEETGRSPEPRGSLNMLQNA